MFKYSNSNKRYYTLDYFYKNKFGQKIAKISQSNVSGESPFMHRMSQFADWNHVCLFQ